MRMDQWIALGSGIKCSSNMIYLESNLPPIIPDRPAYSRDRASAVNRHRKLGRGK